MQWEQRERLVDFHTLEPLALLSLANGLAPSMRAKRCTSDASRMTSSRPERLLLPFPLRAKRRETSTREPTGPEKQAKRDFVILMDPDTIITGDSLPIVYYDGPFCRAKEAVYKCVSEPIVEVVVCATVLLSSLLVALSTLDDINTDTTQTAIRFLLNAVGLVFVADFSARWFASPKDRFQHVLQPSFWTEVVVVICPLVLGLAPTTFITEDFFCLPHWLTSPGAIINLELLRVLRLQRILKDLDTFSKFETAIGLEPRLGVTKDWQLQLARVLLSVFTLLSISSGLIYTAEHGANPDMTDYFTALYFGLTVGCVLYIIVLCAFETRLRRGVIVGALTDSQQRTCVHSHIPVLQTIPDNFDGGFWRHYTRDDGWEASRLRKHTGGCGRLAGPSSGLGGSLVGPTRRYKASQAAACATTTGRHQRAPTC